MKAAQDYTYVGGELDVFAEARNWKTYFSHVLRPHLRGTVVEVGAGLGANTDFLIRGTTSTEWVCLEPDAGNFTRLARSLTANPKNKNVLAVQGMVKDLSTQSANALLYIDVLEHIEKDREEVEFALSRLKPGGILAVLSPAHQYLYSEFDRSIGHYRRYSRKSLLALTPQGAVVRNAIYLDSVGFFLSLANRLLLKQSLPTASQIRIWDGMIIPLSRVMDRIVGFKFGKTILVIWEKPQNGK